MNNELIAAIKNNNKNFTQRRGDRRVDLCVGSRRHIESTDLLIQKISASACSASLREPENHEIIVMGFLSGVCFYCTGMLITRGIHSQSKS